MTTPYRLVVLSLFFLSGICGLVYEVTWLRMFRLVMGNTVLTSATVLTVFMAGLAVGSFLGGRLAVRTPRPLRSYGLLEAGVGLYALLMPVTFAVAEPAYAFLYHHVRDSALLLALGRFAVSSALLLLPTVLMGATLPLLSRFLARRADSLGRDVGRLYALNTLGAAVGTVVAGFGMVPLLGVRLTFLLTAAVNLAICAAALGLARRHERQPEPVSLAAAPAAGVPGRPALLWAVGGAGFASMVYEVAWTRTLTQLIGSSVYAFTLMLVAFITGLGLGSLVLSGWIDRRRNLYLVVGGLEVVVGMAALLVVPLFNRLPFVVIELVTRYSDSFRALHLAEFGVVFGLMLIPTLAMGALFPAVTRAYTRSLQQVGQSVGEVYAANTLGAVLGSFAAGFVLIPWIGVQHAILTGVALNLAIGIAFVLTSGWSVPRARAAVAAVAAGLVAAGIWSMPPWDVMLLNSAPYLYAHRYQGTALREEVDLSRVMRRNRRLLYAEEGMTATVTVVESEGELYLKVNGKTDASSRGDLRSQSLLSHLPLLLHPRPASVLLIGLGSGISLGAAERHPIERVACVEISPEVIQGARYFSSVNHDALRDPRVQLVVGDGRNHVALSEERYDVVISQPSNLWIAGMADLFTREYFDACRGRLAPGGIACSWVQAYCLREQDLRSIVRTFRAAFPHASLWESVPGGDYFLIGSLDPVPLHYGELERRHEERGLGPDFGRIGVSGVSDLLCSYVMEGEDLARFAGRAPLNTDDAATLEFSAPLGLYGGLVGREGIFGIGALAPYRQAEPGWIDGPERPRLLLAWRARQTALGALQEMDRGRSAAALELLQRAQAHSPGDMEVRRLLPQAVQAPAEELLRRGDLDGAADLYQAVVTAVPEEATAHLRLGQIHARRGRPDLAIGEYERAADLAPRSAEARAALAGAWAQADQSARAETVYREALDLDPANLEALGGLGRLYVRQERWEEALSVYGEAHRVDPRDAQMCNNLGVVYFQQRRYEEAVTWFRRAAHHSPTYARAYSNLGDAYAALGRTQEAREALGRALSLEPQDGRAARALQALEAKVP
ncbi:MAG: fused MFS/spermidine synthase [Candidatus Latescibacterota bacterium]